MINQLDEMLRHLLDAGLNDPSLPWTIDVDVRPPDDAWRAAVNAAGRPAVDVYLVETREARVQRSSDAVLRRDAEPFRVDCHYLVTAWIPTADPTFGTPTVVEDWLLGECIRVLSDNLPLNAARVYGSTPPTDLDPVLADLDLPTSLLPPEGFTNLSDFWTGVGQGNTWHPSAHLVVTLPLLRRDQPLAPPVTAIHVSTWPTVEPTGTPDELVVDTAVVIGGAVRTGVGDPVAGAWVRLSDAAGARIVQVATTAADGSYELVGLVPGSYRLSGGAPAHPTVDRPVSVPDVTGDYDLVLT